VGIGGWTYEPWRAHFFPEGLAHSRELAYASRQVSAIEVNGTYYGLQKPATFAKWRDETPDDFVFSLKASRYTTNRRILAEAGDSIDRFVGSGLAELGRKLGPIVWQFAPNKQFEPEDFEAFLSLLPKAVDGQVLRHVLDVRHPSFMDRAYLKLVRKYKAATVFTDSDEYPSFADLTGPLVYARLMRAQAEVSTGYSASALKRWAGAAVTWAEGGQPAGLPLVDDRPVPAKPREVFMFFINGAKENAPAAAMGLLKNLGWNTPAA
jgi:uncharacterized protein YecE (DUF72 family)